jgi:hypothetical protein
VGVTAQTRPIKLAVVVRMFDVDMAGYGGNRSP